MSAMASQITSLTIVYSTVYSGADQRKHQSFALPAFVRGTHRSPGNSPHKCPVTREMFPFDDIIMTSHDILKSYHWISKSYEREHWTPRPCINIRTVFPGVGISIIEIRRSLQWEFLYRSDPIFILKRPPESLWDASQVWKSLEKLQT